MEKVPVVYLDSSDYSVLSDPRRRESGTEKIKADLLAIAAAGEARFAYSGAHLSEMAPISERDSSAAEARADLLSELCGPNAFVSIDKVIRWEIAGLVGAARLENEADLLSNNGEWFPNMGSMLPSSAAASIRDGVAETLLESGLPRVQRRKLARKLHKNGKPTSVLRALGQRQIGANQQTFLDSYPMRPQDAEVLRKYLWGMASAAQADAALLSSLRDPRWMMRWFDKHHEKLGDIGNWLRRPSKEISDWMQTTANAVLPLRAVHDGAVAAVISKELGKPRQDEMLVNTANKITQRLFPELADKPHVDVRVIEKTCPGLSVAMRTLHSVYRDALCANPRVPKASDFVDAAHAIYAPRVSLFRADRYIAPYIRQHLSAGSSIVVSRLDTLLDELRKLLA